MKTLFPIIICSLISAGLGYYFGHITLPVESTQAATESATGQKSAITSDSPSSALSAELPDQGQPQPAVDEFTPAATGTATAVYSGTTPSAPAQPAPDTSGFAARAALSIQTLTDTQDRSIRATILEVTTGEVKIRREDGLVTTIPLSMLSPEDLAFCNYLRENQILQPATAPTPAAPATGSGDDFDWDAFFNN